MHVETWKISGGGFHFGQHGLGQEETSVCMPSDSLFAALVASLAALNGAEAVEAFMRPFLMGSPPFALTSTYPLLGEVCAFPTPKRSLSGVAPESAQVPLKKLKKVQYLSEALFRQVLAGVSLAKLYAAAHPLQDGAVLVSAEEAGKLPAELQAAGAAVWEVEQRPRVTLGRSPQNASIFFTGRVTYVAGCGLWFGVRWLSAEQALQVQLTNLLAHLADAGLGAERSTGFGACQIEPTGALELPEPGRELWVSLSRYLPRAEETGALAHREAAYRLVQVGGWLDSPVRRGQRRRAVNLLEEGAVLGAVEAPIPGQVVDVRPSYASDPDPLGHPVYRSGFALAVGMQGGKP